jgi:hypothetical protein
MSAEHVAERPDKRTATTADLSESEDTRPPAKRASTAPQPPSNATILAQMQAQIALLSAQVAQVAQAPNAPPAPPEVGALAPTHQLGRSRGPQ